MAEELARIEIANEAEEHFGIQLPEDVSHWLTLQDAYNTMALALQSQKGDSLIEPAKVRSFLFEVVKNGYVFKEGTTLDLDFCFDQIGGHKDPT